MNWNDAIQQLFPPKNRVQIAGDKLLPFVEAVKKIDQMAEYTSTGQRKPIAGYRFFSCNECGTHWSEKSRDCRSPSGDICPKCGEINYPWDFEKHPEWLVDKSGNLV